MSDKMSRIFHHIFTAFWTIFEQNFLKELMKSEPIKMGLFVLVA
jgi:hypothetical protein